MVPLDVAINRLARQTSNKKGRHQHPYYRMKHLYGLFFCLIDQNIVCFTSLEQKLTVLKAKTLIFLKKMVWKTEQNESKLKKYAIFKVYFKLIYMVNSSSEGINLV